MKSFLLGLVFLSLAASSGASPDTWRYHKFAADTSGLPLKEAARRVSFKYDRETRSIQLSKWEFDFDPPTADELSQVEHLDVFGAPPGSTVYSEGKWRRKNDVELEDALQAAKSQDRKTLENEYFALVEEIYVAAGEGAPSLEEAKNLGQARAKIAKARRNKPGTGQGNKKTADDALEFLDMQLRLQALELELRGYDPNWRGNAKKHELE